MVTRSRQPEWNGCAPCDSRCATAGSIEAFRHGVDELLGAAWDADLEVYRHAGDGSPVTWLHQVV